MSLYRLTFDLPPAWLLLAQPGRQHPCVHGCRLEVGAAGRVKVEARHRESVFEQTRRFLRPLARDGVPRQITGEVAYLPTWPALGGRDTWHIIVNSQITFSPSRLDPALDRAECPLRPAGGRASPPDQEARPAPRAGGAHVA